MSAKRWKPLAANRPLLRAKIVNMDAWRKRARRSNVVLRAAGSAAATPESVELLDGGEQAYPRMLAAIANASRSVHLEVYTFALSGVGERFIEALVNAVGRGVAVHVLIDGWGSARAGNAVAVRLRAGGCDVRIHNRLRALLIGGLSRNHRKILLIDDELAFLGGINIHDENVGADGHPGWADLALEIRGPQCAHLGRVIRREPYQPFQSALRISLSGLGGGWRLRRRYIQAFAAAGQTIYIAHGYFLPDRGVIRALTAAARRGVEVHILLSGRSDVPGFLAASRSIYRKLLDAGVKIHEWNDSVLHSKVATVDGRRMLVGSFNLDPFSLANLETLVEVDDPQAVERGERWIEDRFARSRPATSAEASSWLRRWLLDPLGAFLARLAEAVSRAIARSEAHRPR